MNVSNQPKLKFHGVDFASVQFNGSKRYDNTSKIDFKVDPKVLHDNENPLIFRIIMDVNLQCKGFFELNLIGIGIFEFDDDLHDENLKKGFINANAPAIMFPYIRSFISILTSNLGSVTGALTIPTQFFHGELDEITE